MSKKVTTTIYIEFSVGRYDQELELECSGMVSGAIRALQHRDGSWDAPEDACVEDLEVGYWVTERDYSKPSPSTKKIWNDFTPFLTKEQIEHIEEKLIESDYD